MSIDGQIILEMNVNSIGRGRVSLGFEAPEHIRIDRISPKNNLQENGSS